MIQFGLDPDRVNAWLLNLAILGLSVLEFSLVGYVVTLTLYESHLIR